MKLFRFILVLSVVAISGCGLLSHAPRLAESKRLPVSMQNNGINGNVILMEDSRFHVESKPDQSGPIPVVDFRKASPKRAVVRLIDATGAAVDDFPLSGERAELYDEEVAHKQIFRVATTKLFGPKEQLLDSDVYFFDVENGHLKQLSAQDETGQSEPLVLRFKLGGIERYAGGGERMFQIHCTKVDTPDSVIRYDIYKIGSNGVSKVTREQRGLCPRYGSFPESQLPSN